MTPPLLEVLERIYELPHALETRLWLGRPVSLQGLVAETGYPAVAERIDAEVLRLGLQERQAIVGVWLRYSTGKQAAWGWFFEEDRRGFFTVGMRSRYSDQTRCEIANRWAACAYFIKQELDAITGRPAAAPKTQSAIIP